MNNPFDIDKRVDDRANPYNTSRTSLGDTQEHSSAHKVDSLERSTEPISRPNLRTKKTQPSTPSRATSPTKKRLSLKSKITRSSSAIAVTMALIFGGGTIAILSGPSIAIVQMKEVLTSSLNDQLHAMDSRASMIFKAKMKTKGSPCKGLTACEDFKNMTNRQVQKFEKNRSGIKIDRDMTSSTRGEVTKISFTNDTGKTVTFTNGSQLQAALDSDVDFKTAWTKGYNPKYTGLSDSLFSKILTKLKITKNTDISGKNNKERMNKVNRTVGGLENSSAKSVITSTDKDGNTIYEDEKGNRLTKSQVESAEAIENRVEDYASKGGSAGVLKEAVAKGVMIDAGADLACSVYNGVRHVSALSKMIKAAQSSRYAMAMVLTPADKIKAGDATEGEITFVGDTLMNTDSSGDKVLDESKINQTANGDVPTIDNPNTGNAFDSKGFQIASGETVGPLNSGDARYMLAGAGSPAIIDSVMNNISKVLTGGSGNPFTISHACGFIQSWFVRAGALAAGFITGVATLGVSTVILGGASIGIALIMPLIESQLADIITGDVFKDISGYDSGDAAYVGTASVLGATAQARGMEPVTTTSGKDYLALNNQTKAKYNSIDRRLASNTPFDIYNPNSFMGSIAASLVPYIQRSSSGTWAAIMNTIAFIPSTFGSILKPAYAATPTNYFGKCNDQMYQALGIDAGPFCEIRYAMSSAELSIDPIQNVLWMINSNNIGSDGVVNDNGASWNYVKFLKNCVNRSVGWGETDEDGTTTGAECIDPKLSSLNTHFRAYTMDKSINDSMNESDSTSNTPGTSGYTDGEKSQVSKDGWALPVDIDDGITFGYQPGHEGINLAASTDSATVGQAIFSVRDGTVIAAGPSSQYGNWIVISHKYKGKDIASVYAYLNTDGVLVHQGDTVKAGQQIGRIGNQGSGSRPYLYFQLWNGSPLSSGAPTDPTNTFLQTQSEIRGRSL